jgi:hypothetical protein
MATAKPEALPSRERDPSPSVLQILGFSRRVPSSCGFDETSQDDVEGVVEFSDLKITVY